MSLRTDVKWLEDMLATDIRQLNQTVQALHNFGEMQQQLIETVIKLAQRVEALEKEAADARSHP